jgi:hypothetical protein
MKTNLKIGEVLFGRGFNNKCKPCIVKCQVVRILNERDEYGRDCVVLTGGIKMLEDSRKLFKTKGEVR